MGAQHALGTRCLVLLTIITLTIITQRNNCHKLSGENHFSKFKFYYNVSENKLILHFSIIGGNFTNKNFPIGMEMIFHFYVNFYVKLENMVGAESNYNSRVRSSVSFSRCASLFRDGNRERLQRQEASCSADLSRIVLRLFPGRK